MGEQLTIADYEEVLADHRRIAREIDVSMYGRNAARQASLCDLQRPIWTLVHLVKSARCPNSCVNGRLLPDGDQCQWCAERSQFNQEGPQK